MTDNNAQRFTTHSRDEAILESIKIADLLSEHGILDKTIKILIVGGDGKSLIVDAISRHLSQDHDAIDMPKDRFVEGVPLASADLKKRKKINHKDQSCNIKMTHVWDNLSPALKVEKPSWFNSLFNKYFNQGHDAIHFVTTHYPPNVEPAIKSGAFEPDITIEFDLAEDWFDDDPDTEFSWDKPWKIVIHNKDLQKIHDAQLKATNTRAAKATTSRVSQKH